MGPAPSSFGGRCRVFLLRVSYFLGADGSLKRRASRDRRKDVSLGALFHELQSDQIESRNSFDAGRTPAIGAGIPGRRVCGLSGGLKQHERARADLLAAWSPLAR